MTQMLELYQLEPRGLVEFVAQANDEVCDCADCNFDCPEAMGRWDNVLEFFAGIDALASDVHSENSWLKADVKSAHKGYEVQLLRKATNYPLEHFDSSAYEEILRKIFAISVMEVRMSRIELIGVGLALLHRSLKSRFGSNAPTFTLEYTGPEENESGFDVRDAVLYRDGVQQLQLLSIMHSRSNHKAGYYISVGQNEVLSAVDCSTAMSKVVSILTNQD